MCGIVGRVNFDGEPVNEAFVRQMCGLIAHRGPDSEGVHLDGAVGMGVRRLSIIDVAGGQQPMCNEDGSIWIVYNGEIYNFQELAAELEAAGHRFGTRCDTEVVLHLYEQMGERCVTRLNGMFAFAIWDSKQRRLVLGRDRLGKKPIHYAMRPGHFIFGSEIEALLADRTLERRINFTALQQYLSLWYVPSPLTMFEGIFKLPPAHTLVLQDGQVRLERYWDVDYSQKLQLSEPEWMERINALLADAVRIRLMSEVPLGALLSGGIDSAAVVALMAKFSAQPVKTFSIGFTQDSFNELPYARRFAELLGTEHYEEIVEPDAATLLPELVRHYGEPFGDDSCIPTYCVSKMARKHVTVALGGDGGDECFGGYPRLARYMTFSPTHSLRGLVVSNARRVAGSAQPVQALLDGGRWHGFWSELKFRSAEIADPVTRYAHEWVVWKNGSGHPLTARAAQAVGRRPLAPLYAAWEHGRGLEPMDRLLYLELMTYLPDDLQVKIDRASMAASLEVRAPFLDYRLVELSASMPPALKLCGGQTKVLLRKALRGLVPDDILGRSKAGFSVPIKQWLANELRPMVQDLLLSPTFAQRGVFEPAVVKKMLAAETAGKGDYSRHLWLLLNFEIWAREFL